jgi:hypothetical protein
MKTYRKTPLKEALAKIATEPVALNAFRESQGKDRIGRAELAAMREMKAADHALAHLEMEILRVPELRREAERTKLFTISREAGRGERKSAATKAVEKALHCEIATVGARHEAVREIADARAHARFIVAKLDGGAKLSAMQGHIQYVKDDVSSAYASFARLHNALPKDAAERSLKEMQDEARRFLKETKAWWSQGREALSALSGKFEKASTFPERSAPETATPSRAARYDGLRRKR